MKPRHRHRTSPAARSSGPPWSGCSERDLLALRLRDLKLRLADTPVQRSIDRLYAELARAGLRLRPHCWLAEEWFSPDGVPGIAIPFFLAHPRLKRLEKRMMHEVEGGTPGSLMRILRHEAGHTLDTAFGLRRRKDWQAVFGSPSRPYPDTFRPRAGSRRFVHHLYPWYAQVHPTEDFAETFAVWLTPGGAWRREYRGWAALRKLLYVDALMQELQGVKPPVRRRRFVEPLTACRRTLGEHYRDKQARHTAAYATGRHPI